ncbi:MAG: helicase of box family protein [Gammaproteobacteria bacterium]|nr:helicase of box family protein [Gammaproteobacteria bacterium]
MSCAKVAQTSECPTTRPARGSTRRLGSYTGYRGSPLPTSVRRTSHTRLRSVDSNGTFEFPVRVIRTLLTKLRRSLRVIGTTRTSGPTITTSSAPVRKTGPTDRATILLSPTDFRPEPFQERLLEQIALSRQQGHHRNLLVAATGTGKTVMAALEYQGLRESLSRARLLFVAHREEILTQSRATLQQALRDPLFGEFWVGGHRPQQFEYVFASIQSLNAAGLAHLDPTHFDILIVDEVHHAAAQSSRATRGFSRRPVCSAAFHRVNRSSAQSTSALLASCDGSTNSL